MRNTLCPLGGDESDCGSCAYGSDYKFDEVSGDCVVIPDDRDNIDKFLDYYDITISGIYIEGRAAARDFLLAFTKFNE